MKPDTMMLEASGGMPNNPELPVLHYHGVLDRPTDEAAETLFDRNGWPARWRNGIFSYHHYHSTAHEALAVVRGSARVMLGGPEGREVTLEAGDVVILPAGTGHCRIAADEDFRVVGAYPAGQDWDLRRDPADEATLKRIAQVPVPDSDPVTGKDGGLNELWSRA